MSLLLSRLVKELCRKLKLLHWISSRVMSSSILQSSVTLFYPSLLFYLTQIICNGLFSHSFTMNGFHCEHLTEKCHYSFLCIINHCAIDMNESEKNSYCLTICGERSGYVTARHKNDQQLGISSFLFWRFLDLICGALAYLCGIFDKSVWWNFLQWSGKKWH